MTGCSPASASAAGAGRDFLGEIALADALLMDHSRCLELSFVDTRLQLAGVIMGYEIDHIFVLTDTDAPSAGALLRLGLTEGPPNRHAGQGTANRRFFFDNAMLELLWVENVDEAAIRPRALYDLRIVGLSVRLLRPPSVLPPPQRCRHRPAAV